MGVLEKIAEIEAEVSLFCMFVICKTFLSHSHNIGVGKSCRESPNVILSTTYQYYDLHISIKTKLGPGIV